MSKEGVDKGKSGGSVDLYVISRAAFFHYIAFGILLLLLTVFLELYPDEGSQPVVYIGWIIFAVCTIFVVPFAAIFGTSRETQ